MVVSMQVAVIGSLRVVHGQRAVEVAEPRVRALLVRLAWDCGRLVGADALVDAVWPGEPPEHPGAAVQSLVSRLRRALPGDPVVTGPAGSYRLDLAADAVDAHRFQRLAREAREALESGQIARAAASARQALALWTGEPLLDAGRADFAEVARVRLSEVWLSVVEDRLETDLLSGRERTVAAEAEALIRAHPLRERLRVLAMRGLVTEGSNGAALRVYEQARRMLAEELGVDPGPQLQREYLAVLHGRPALPTPLTTLIGREPDCAAVRAIVSAHRLVTLTGPGGVGKTRLAIHVAGTRPDRAAQACALVDLSGCVGADSVVSAVSAMIGSPRIAAPETAADQLTRLRQAVGHQRVLLVLDNCEHVLAEAAAVSARLLADCPGVRILATSREPLGLLGERLYPVHPLPLPDPGAADPDGASVRLFLDRDLAAVVAWSRELLDAGLQQQAARLAVFAGTFTPEAATAIGTPWAALDKLADRSLLQPAHGRYRMLDTIRAYARSRLDESDATVRVRAAHLEYTLTFAEARAARLRTRDQGSALDEFTAERENLTAAFAFALECRDGFGRALALTFLGLADYLRGDIATATTELSEAARLVQALGATGHYQRAWLAHLHARAGHRDTAEDLLREIRARAGGADAALAELFTAELARHSGEFERAARHLTLACDGPSGPHDTLLRLAQAQLATARDQFAAATEYLRAAWDCAATPDMPMAAAIAVGAANLMSVTGRAGGAAEVLGAAQRLRGTASAADPDVHAVRSRLVQRLGPVFDERYQQGRDLARTPALALVHAALSADPDSGGSVTAT